MARRRGPRPGWSEAEEAEAAEAKKRREGMTRPLQMSDLSGREQTEAMKMLNEKNVGIRARIASRIAGAKSPAPADVAALGSPKLRARAVSLRQMSNALTRRTERAATGPERLPNESLAGTGFYFDQRRELAAANPPDVHTLALASSRLSPKTRPVDEAKTAVALSKAHSEQGTVRFTPSLVAQLGKSYVDSDGAHRPGVDASEHLGKIIPFSQLDAGLVSHMRKAHNRDAAIADSQGIDWDSMRSVGLDANVQRAHRVLQGDQSATPDIFQNPKQTGYAASISEATPGPVEEEYKFRAAHLGGVIRGEVSAGQTALDTTGLLHSNEGMLSNTAPIAGDTWTRRASSGQHLDVAGPVANTFITAKGNNVGKGDARVTPLGIEHAAQQAAVEGAARSLQRRYQTEFTVPSRLIQETGGWAQPRRESGGDAEFNATVGDSDPTPNRNVGKQFKQIGLF